MSTDDILNEMRALAAGIRSTTGATTRKILPWSAMRNTSFSKTSGTRRRKPVGGARFPTQRVEMRCERLRQGDPSDAHAQSPKHG